jgi:hypothetical protein
MTCLDNPQNVKVERLEREVEVWKTKYFDQLKTDEEWEVYIKKSREQALEQSKQKVLFWILGLLWFLLVIYELKK